MQKITPFLWFQKDAEAAAKLYVSVFGGELVSVTPMSATFRIHGQEIIAFNGGTYFQLNEAASLYVDCADQAEVDRLWAALLEGGGTPSRCGWLKDRFGLSWQIIPTGFQELLNDKDPKKADAVRKSMMTMAKLDIAALRSAHASA